MDQGVPGRARRGAPRLSAEWLLCAATGLARIDLYMRMDETLNAAQLETMHAAVVRRAKGEPLQYITGSTQFRMIDVTCAPGVLIPRPETEMLVEEVLNYLDAEVLSPEAAARQRVELPWNDEVE
ncbi:MAG: peptide chain release factor N(5)-glutamine methyltransferase, partial [Collinsella sp.]